jgi:hypothetical protein
MSGAHETGNHEPIQIRPRRLTVQEQNDVPVTRAFVDVGHSQRVAAARIYDVDVVRVKGEVG